MAWYKTGTVTVTAGSTAVIGVGTKFVSNTRVGDGFRGPDGEWYEIVNMASETALGIYPAYQGTSVALSSNYMVAPLQGYNKESADRLRAITDNIANVDASVAAAAASAAAAKTSETNSKTSETNAKTSETNAATSRTQAATSATAAATSKTGADTAAATATTKAGEASTSAANALTQANRAKTEADRVATLVPVTGPTDVTPGRLVTPGWMGLGTASGLALPGGSANTAQPAGRYFVQTTWTGSPFTGNDNRNRGYIDVLGWGQDGYQMQEFTPLFYGDANPKMFRTNVGGTWRAWTPITSGYLAARDSVTGGQVLTVGHAGWNGGYAIVVGAGADCNTLTNSNVYALNSSYTNGPSFFIGNPPIYIVTTTHGAGYEHQMAFGIIQPLRAERRSSNGTWGEWVVVYNGFNATTDPASGGLMSFGSNTNGSYAKYANGVLVCWNYVGTVTFTATNRFNASWTFPIPFVGPIPFVNAQGAGRMGGVIQPCAWQTYAQDSLTGATCAVQQTGGTNIDDVRNLAWHAVGRWRV